MSKVKGKRKFDDEELDEEEGNGGFDDLDLRDHTDSDGSEAEEENQAESAAEKRLRLAKSYLSQLKKLNGGETLQTEKRDFFDQNLEQSNNLPEAFDAAEIDRELISDRLKQDVLEQKLRMFYRIADRFASLHFDARGGSNRKFIRGGKKGHRLSVTAVAVCCPSFNFYKANRSSLLTPPGLPSSSRECEAEYSANRPPVYIFSSSKDGSIIQYDFYSGRRLHETVAGLKQTRRVRKAVNKKNLETNAHFDHVLALEGSPDGRYLASAGRDKHIKIWNVLTHELYATLKQHRDCVSDLSFRKTPNTTHLYSASFDRTVKVWNVPEKSYIETLFGHQDQVTSIDALLRERCVTAGARERTLRLWKIVEESQLVYRGGGSFEDEARLAPKAAENQAALGASVDVVVFVDDEHWISGSDTGALSLWNFQRKKPLFVRLRAHKTNADAFREPLFETAPPASCGIVSLASVKYSDLFASGSWNGSVLLWKLEGDKKSFAPLCEIPAPGFINSLCFFYAPRDTTVFPESDQKPTSKLVNPPLPHLSQQASTTHDQLNYSLYLVLGIGQEHKLGRWRHLQHVHNGVELIKLG